jgi:hypothetical protein
MMINRLRSSLIAAALSATFAVASPALAFHGGMGGGGMHMGGGWGGGWHGPMHMNSMMGPVHANGWSGTRHVSRFAFHDRDDFRFRHFDRDDFFRHRFDRDDFFRHHRFRHHFAFAAAPFDYTNYSDCWRRVWTPYGPQWVDICGAYPY